MHDEVVFFPKHGTQLIFRGWGVACNFSADPKPGSEPETGGGAICGVDAGCIEAGAGKKEDESEQGGKAQTVGGEEAGELF
jgi:hypothetical protein